MGDITQDYARYGAEKSIEIHCPSDRCNNEIKLHAYRALLKTVSDEKPSFVYGCVTCFTP